MREFIATTQTLMVADSLAIIECSVGLYLSLTGATYSGQKYPTIIKDFSAGNDDV
jgi:hypothetical protein